MAGFENDIIFAKNGDFTQADNQNVLESNGLVVNGKLWIGSTALNAGGTHINVGSLTSPSGTLTVGYSSPNITLDVTSGGPVLETLSDDVGTIVTPLANNIQLVGHINNAGGKFSTTVSGTHLLNLNPMSASRWIVDPLGFNGTHTTIASAIASATSGETIFILPGTYTENLTLKAGVDLVAYTGDSDTPNVTIVGNATFSSAGTVSISNVRLQTNSAAFLTVSGSVASIVNLNNCYLNCTNSTGISYTSSSASSAVNLMRCNGDITTTGIALFSMSSAGTLNILYTLINNSGASTTANTASAGTLIMRYMRLTNPLTTSNTNNILAFTHSIINTESQNVTSFTAGGTGSAVVECSFFSGTASAISIGGTLEMRLCGVSSSNTNAITGAGTLTYSSLAFRGSSTINTTTQSAFVFNPGIWRSSLQPAFLVTANNQTDVTGDGTTYTVLFANEIFDQDNDFSSPTFTAPLTGRYQFNVTIELGDLQAANTAGSISIVTSNRTYITSTCNWANFRNGANAARISGSVLSDMDAADTATIQVVISLGTKTVDVNSTTTWSGFLFT